MKAKLVIPKGWRRLKFGDEIRKGDRIFSQYTDELEWVDVIAMYEENLLRAKRYGYVMAGEKQTVIRRVGK